MSSKKTWRVTLWVDGFDGELTTWVEADTEDEAHEIAYDELHHSPRDVIECEEDE